jgi:hypothetical protein
MLDFVMVIPTLNEEKYIGEIVKSSDTLLSSMFKKYKIIVVDESSNDTTIKIVNKLMKSHKSLELITNRTPGNRGFDVRYGLSRYDSKLYFFADADLKPSLPYLKNMIKAEKNGFDVVTGSRYVDEKLINRPPLRKSVSKTYNFMLNVLFNENIKDHQCGFKLFNRKAFRLINRLSREKHWCWDAESLFIALYNNLKIYEIPITFVERRSNRTPIRRLVKDILVYAPGTARLYYRFRILRDYS